MLVSLRYPYQTLLSLPHYNYSQFSKVFRNHQCPPAKSIKTISTKPYGLTLLQSLSGSMSIALKMLEEHPEQKDALGEFEFAAGLGQILLGQPLAKDQNPGDSGRLSDGALVKLFRIVRLARRLIDLEIQAFNGTTPPTDS